MEISSKDMTDTKEAVTDHLRNVLQGARQIAEVDVSQRMFEAYNSTSAIVTSLLPLLDVSAPEVASKVRECLEEIQVAVHGREVAEELKSIWAKE